MVKRERGKGGRKKGHLPVREDPLLGKDGSQSVQIGCCVVPVLYRKDFGSGLLSDSPKVVWSPTRIEREVSKRANWKNKAKQNKTHKPVLGLEGTHELALGHSLNPGN